MQFEVWQHGIGAPHWWARLLGFAAAFGALLGLIGPFGSFLNDEAPVRILYFAAMCIVGATLAALAVPPSLRIGARHGVPALFAFVVAVLLTAVPGTALSWVVAHRLWAYQVGRVTPAEWYGQSALLSLCIAALWTVLEQLRRNARQPVRAAPATVPVAAAPVDENDPVLCLQMEDHYVRVHRAGGSTLELLPMHEAVQRYGRAGLQVHRSWWVAASSVVAAERDARNWRLRLSNGLLVPVARNRVADLRARGWIQAGEGGVGSSATTVSQ